MKFPRNHSVWLKNRKERQSAYKDKVAVRKDTGRGRDTKSNGKLALSKSFKSALTTHVKCFDKGAEYVMAQVEKKNDKEEGEE